MERSREYRCVPGTLISNVNDAGTEHVRLRNSLRFVFLEINESPSELLDFEPTLPHVITIGTKLVMTKANR